MRPYLHGVTASTPSVPCTATGDGGRTWGRGDGHPKVKYKVCLSLKREIDPEIA